MYSLRWHWLDWLDWLDWLNWLNWLPPPPPDTPTTQRQPRAPPRPPRDDKLTTRPVTPTPSNPPDKLATRALKLDPLPRRPDWRGIAARWTRSPELMHGGIARRPVHSSNAVMPRTVHCQRPLARTQSHGWPENVGMTLRQQRPGDHSSTASRPTSFPPTYTTCLNSPLSSLSST